MAKWSEAQLQATFGAHLTPAEFRHYRQTLKHTQDELAAVLGVSRSQINRWENGHAPIPRMAELAMDRIADKLYGF